MLVPVLVLALLSPQQQQTAPPAPEQMQAAMAMLAAGPGHKDLEPLAGTWRMTTTFAMGTGQRFVVTGSTVNRLVLGARFLHSESSGTGEGLPGPLEALTIYGFDRRTGEYTLVGFDTMGTYYVTAAGRRKAGARDVVMAGEIDETAGGRTQRMKYDMVLRWIDADTYATEIIFHLPEGDLKIAESIYTRVK